MGKAAISWSAGKDACLALLRAREAGIEVATYFTMCDPDGRSKGHLLDPALVAAQVDALGGQWRAVSCAWPEYAATFDGLLASLRDAGHTQVVYGDIDLQAHRDWLDAACERAGLEARFPLWGEDRRAVAREVIARGIRARVVCVDTRWLDASYCAVPYDEAFLARLPAHVCPCGEGGEFHTYVADAPGFRHPVALVSCGVRTLASQPPLAPTQYVVEDLACAP